MNPKQFQKLKALADELCTAGLLEGVILSTMAGLIYSGCSVQPIAELCLKISEQMLAEYEI